MFTINSGAVSLKVCPLVGDKISIIGAWVSLSILTAAYLELPAVSST